MKLAIVGSRGLTLDNLCSYLPDGVTEIVSGGARGIDLCAEKYAKQHNIKFTVFLPDYKKYKKGAPLKRNIEIINYADHVLAFWDKCSKGTEFVINTCKKMKKKITVYIIE